MKSGWLIASVFLNLLLIGVIAGLLMRSGPKHREASPPPPITTDVSPEDRRAVRAVLRQGFEASKPLRDEQKAIRSELAQLLAQEPYDADAVISVLTKLRASQVAVQEAIHAAIEPELIDLSLEQRKVVAEALARGGKRSRGPRGGDRRPTGPRPE